MRTVPAPSIPTPPRRLSTRGRHGALEFRLCRLARGLYVEREDHPCRGLRTLEVACFAQAREFERWCDDDPVRFDHPQLYVQLRREADTLWRGHASE